MASLKLTGDTSGEITISAPAVAGTNTLTLPANTGTIITSATAAADVPAPTQLSTASGSAPSYSARAWVNFDGTGTVSISASGNVSSITDNAQGLYTVNMSTAMPNTNYAVTGTAVGSFQGTDGSNGRCGSVSPNLNGTYSTSSFQVITKDSADINFDSSKVGIAVFI